MKTDDYLSVMLFAGSCRNILHSLGTPYMGQRERNQYRALKQELSRVQINIKHSLKADTLPRPEDSARFIRLSQEMHLISDKDWLEAMERYAMLLEKFSQAVESGNLHAVQDSFRQLLECKASCHKQFRHT